jgi:hypothetical protein
MNPPCDDYDTPWKSAIEAYFREFLSFYFPGTCAAIDWRVPPAFLEQDLAPIAPGARIGMRRLDRLVRVATLDGREACIHIEIQRRRERAFAERIFVYHYRLFDHFHCPIASLVLLADPSPSWRPEAYWCGFAGCGTGIQFPVAKLLD